MGQTIELLENALRAWEDCFLLYEARIRIGIETGIRKREELVGPARHWRELRNHLLNLKGGDFDLKRFGYTETGVGLTSGPFAKRVVDALQIQEQDVADNNNVYEALPLQLASWIISSRRVFQLSKELVDRFLATDYSAYTWSDLLWPFDSFFISFESPYAWRKRGGEEIETLGLLISSVYGVCPEHELAQQDGFECLPFFQEAGYARESLLTEKDRERLENDLRHKRWVKLNKRVTNVYKALVGDALFESDSDTFALPPGYGTPIRFAKSGRIESHVEDKILAGLCLYLEALPSGTVDAYSWHQSQQIRAKRDVRKIITDGEHICRVEDFNVLSPDTITLFPETLKKGPAYTVTPHWRRAHLRRPKGSPPDAPKTIRVKAAPIHKDQLPEGAVVGGAISSIR